MGSAEFWSVFINKPLIFTIGKILMESFPIFALSLSLRISFLISRAYENRHTQWKHAGGFASLSQLSARIGQTASSQSSIGAFHTFGNEP